MRWLCCIIVAGSVIAKHFAVPKPRNGLAKSCLSALAENIFVCHYPPHIQSPAFANLDVVNLCVVTIIIYDGTHVSSLLWPKHGRAYDLTSERKGESFRQRN